MHQVNFPRVKEAKQDTRACFYYNINTRHIEEGRRERAVVLPVPSALGGESRLLLGGGKRNEDQTFDQK